MAVGVIDNRSYLRAVDNRPYLRAVDNRPYLRAIDNRPYGRGLRFFYNFQHDNRDNSVSSSELSLFDYTAASVGWVVLRLLALVSLYSSSAASLAFATGASVLGKQ